MSQLAKSATRAQVFVSYAAEDGEPALGALRIALNEAGFEATGGWTMNPGRRWTEELNGLISAADAAVVLITRTALTSTALAQEASVIRQRDEQDDGFRVIPLPIGDISWKDLMGGPFNWLVEYQFPQGPTTEARIDFLMTILQGEESLYSMRTESAASESAASVSSGLSEDGAGSAPWPAGPPAMSQSTRAVFSSAAGMAGPDAIDASAVLISALRYA